MKIPRPGVDLLPFFWSSRLRFSVFREESCYSGPVPYTGLSLFLSSYRASKCHIPNNLFFNITLPLPNHTDIFLNCFFDWCWVVGGCDWHMMWYGSFSILYQCTGSPLEEDKIWMWPFGLISHPISTHCLFFLLHFTVMIKISALNSCFLCALWQIEDGVPRPCQWPPQKHSKKKQLAFC